MKTVAIIQARMGSTRLPGKVMLPLGKKYVITRVIERVDMATAIDQTCVATSTGQQDDIIERYAKRAGANVFRGSESDVLGRIYNAALSMDADIVVRATADCPLVSPELTDIVVNRIKNSSADYVSTKIDRTFPRAIGVAAFTIDSFKIVGEKSKKPYEREHVIPFYHKHQDQFDTINIRSDEVFEAEKYIDRTDIRVTLDEANDYELLRKIYENVDYDETPDIKTAIDYIDNRDLTNINNNVKHITEPVTKPRSEE